jgi:uncharacterized membrane protein
MAAIWSFVLPWLVLGLQVLGAAIALGVFMAIVCAVFAVCIRIVDRITGWY